MGQQTDEGLPIAAVSYHVVGLIACLLKGIDTMLQALFGYSYISAVLTALSVPVVVVAVMWYVVRRIRRSPLDEN